MSGEDGTLEGEAGRGRRGGEGKGRGKGCAGRGTRGAEGLREGVREGVLGEDGARVGEGAREAEVDAGGRGARSGGRGAGGRRGRRGAALTRAGSSRWSGRPLGAAGGGGPCALMAAQRRGPAPASEGPAGGWSAPLPGPAAGGGAFLAPPPWARPRGEGRAAFRVGGAGARAGQGHVALPRGWGGRGPRRSGHTGPGPGRGSASGWGREGALGPHGGWGGGGDGRAWMLRSLGREASAPTPGWAPPPRPSPGCLIGGLPSALPALARYSPAAFRVPGDPPHPRAVAGLTAGDVGPRGPSREGKRAEASALPQALVQPEPGGHCSVAPRPLRPGPSRESGPSPQPGAPQKRLSGR